MLNGKQKRYLRALANSENALFQIGKNNLSDSLFEGLREALESRELVKVSVLKTCELDMNEIAVEICAHTRAELVQKIGRTLVLYKASKEHKIVLP